MIKNVLSEIGGVGVYGVISICLFFLVFVTALVRACLLKQSTVREASLLPLEDGRPASLAKGESRHE